MREFGAGLRRAPESRDLVAPPGNRLDALHGDREGQYSVRINDQWRLCFVGMKGTHTMSRSWIIARSLHG
jgi:plasmid maintenance system killer protein